MKTILISAGHNPGTDSGAVGQGQYECNENIAIADRVVLYLRAWGISTIYMPNNVGDLQAEINWANANMSEGQGYAIQIHRNAGGGTGNEVWTTDYLNQIKLATAILNAMNSLTKLKSRGVKDIKTSSWPLGWINYVNAESVLIEARFIDVDSITDADDMLDAYAIACGIADFLGVPRGKSEEQKQIEAVKAAEIAAATARQSAIDAENARLLALKVAEDAKTEKALKDAIAAKLIADELAAKTKLELEKAEADKIAAETALHDAALNSLFTNWLRELFKKISNWFVSWEKKL